MAPPVLDGSNAEASRVVQILDSRKRFGKLDYLVDWEGLGPEARTWIPSEQLDDQDEVVIEFHRNNPNRPTVPKRNYRLGQAKAPLKPQYPLIRLGNPLEE
jgi:hypothetical protein